MKKDVYFLDYPKDLYSRALLDVMVEEFKELYPQARCNYLKTAKDLFRAKDIFICGQQEFSPGLLWLGFFLRKRVLLYHLCADSALFARMVKKARWIVVGKKSDLRDQYSYYPSPVLLGDLATPKRIERIWNRERLMSKRGSIGVVGLPLGEEELVRIIQAVDLLIEDMDLNVVFIPLLNEDQQTMPVLVKGIKYSANTRYVRSEKYSYTEVLGLLSNVDIVLTADDRGVISALAVNKTVVSLREDEAIVDLLGGVTEEQIVLSIADLSGEDIYSKIKLCLVHREAIKDQLQGRVLALKRQAVEGIRQLGKMVFSP